MQINNALASVAVKNVDASAKWYEQLLNRPSSRPMASLAEWRFDRGGGLQVYQLPDRAGSGSFTLVVSSVEEIITHLQKLGVDVSNRTANEQVRTVMITDPDGNHIAFAEALDPRLAH